jgi:hypothetical protein
MTKCVIKYAIVFFICFGVSLLQAQDNIPNQQIEPGQLWNDSQGRPINAHGGGVLFHNGIYYWHGTHKTQGLSEKNHADGGIHCYASHDLVKWFDMGRYSIW